MKRFTCLFLFVLVVGSAQLKAQDKDLSDEKYALKARPIAKQCDALQDGDNAAVAQASKELASADPARKIQLLGELAKSCHKKSTEPVSMLLQDKDPLVRQAAVEALGQLGDVESIETLIDAATDPDWRVRFSIGVALCSFQKPNASAAALNRLMLVAGAAPLSEGDLRARLHTGIQINQLRDASFSRKTFNYFFGMMDHENEHFRKLLGEAMLALKESKNAQYDLIGILKQAINPVFRRKAAYWLGQLKIERGRAQLWEVAENDADETVRKTAQESLKLLGPSDDDPPAITPKTKAVTPAAKASASSKVAPKTTKKK